MQNKFELRRHIDVTMLPYMWEQRKSENGWKEKRSSFEKKVYGNFGYAAFQIKGYFRVFRSCDAKIVCSLPKKQSNVCKMNFAGWCWWHIRQLSLVPIESILESLINYGLVAVYSVWTFRIDKVQVFSVFLCRFTDAEKKFWRLARFVYAWICTLLEGIESLFQR
jgi:hypothetical protein